MTMIEDRIRAVLASQAAAMRSTTEESPVAGLVPVTETATRRRPRLLLVAAAAVLLAASGLALAQRRTDGPAADEPAAPATFRFETPTVLLQAASVKVTVAGKAFVPDGDLRVEGDPGTPNEYTTLELTWHQYDVEQRINIYFASDGTNWWANEIRTYDGQPNGEWIERQGEFFKSALGATYTGDLDLPNLEIHGMRLDVFRRPSSCDNPTAPLALVTDYPKIEAAAGLGYGATLKVIDTATCQPLAAGAFTFDYTSDDPAVAALAATQAVIADAPPTQARVDLDLVAPGSTTIHAVARDQAGNVVGTADMHVVVGPRDETIVTGAQPVPTTSQPPSP